MKSDERKQIILETAGATAATKGAIAAADYLHNRKNKYPSFNHVLADYAGVRKGDVIMFQDSFASSKIHPVIITEAAGHKSKYIEMYPGKSVIHEGILKDKLEYLTHEQGKFNPNKSSVLGGVFRDPGFNETKFHETVEHVKSHANTYKYNPLKTSFNVKGCTDASCITFADSITRSSSDIARKPNFLPTEYTKSLAKVRDAKVKLINNVSALPLAMIFGGGLTAIKADDAKTKAIGTGAAAVGGTILASRHARQIAQMGSGFASHALGNDALKSIVSSDKLKRTVGGLMLGGAALTAALGINQYNKT